MQTKPQTDVMFNEPWLEIPANNHKTMDIHHCLTINYYSKP